MPVALIGRLAIDQRATGRRLGEALQWMRFGAWSTSLASSGASGIIVDAKGRGRRAVLREVRLRRGDVGLLASRMFLAPATARAAFGTE